MTVTEIALFHITELRRMCMIYLAENLIRTSWQCLVALKYCRATCGVIIFARTLIVLELVFI